MKHNFFVELKKAKNLKKILLNSVGVTILYLIFNFISKRGFNIDIYILQLIVIAGFTIKEIYEKYSEANT